MRELKQRSEGENFIKSVKTYGSKRNLDLKATFKFVWCVITKNVIILTHLPVFFEFNLHKIALFRASQCPEEPEGSPTFFFYIYSI